MLSMLVLCVALTGRLGVQELAPLVPQFRLFPWDNLDAYRTQQLHLARNRRAGLEEMNEMYAEHISSFSKHRFLTPERKTRLQKQLGEMLECGRVKVEFLKRYERELELWGEQRDLNPGSETDRVALKRIEKLLKEEMAWQDAWEAGRIAPMPHEVKQ